MNYSLAVAHWGRPLIGRVSTSPTPESCLLLLIQTQRDNMKMTTEHEGEEEIQHTHKDTQKV